MATARSMLAKSGAIIAVAVLGGALFTQPAAAHSGSFYKERSGCVYTGGMSALHNYAWTEKNSGGCSGHAWLRVRYNDGSYWEGSNATRITMSTGTNGMTNAWHKTQSSESWVASH
jgi:hypothetical protein